MAKQRKATPAAGSGSGSSLSLDPADPTDRQIMSRQAKAARAAGAGGRDRARTTRGRKDLEEAFDQGAAEQPAPAADDDQAAEPESGPSRATRAKAAAGKAGAAAGKAGRESAEFLSRGRWAPTLTPPSRARDTGSLLTGMLLYVALTTYLRYGLDGWKGWLSAKFLNKPIQGLGVIGPPQTVPQPRGRAS